MKPNEKAQLLTAVLLILIVAAAIYFENRPGKPCALDRRAVSAVTTCWGCTPPKVTVYFSDGTQETVNADQK